MSGRRSIPSQRDAGAVLPLVLVFILVLGLVLAATARYTGTNLRYSTVVRDRSEATTSAEAALRYAIQRVDSNAVTSCENGPVTIAPTHDPAADPVLRDADEIGITCTRLDDTEPATLSDWAAVVTGIGVADAGVPCPAGSCELLIDEQGGRAATGRIFMPSLRRDDFRILSPVDIDFDGNLFYDGTADDCGTVDRYSGLPAHDDDIEMRSGSFVCWPQTWDQIVDEPPRHDSFATATPSPSGVNVGGCRVFEPGRYTSLNLDIGGHNYFKSGIYVFDDVNIHTGGADTYILGGFPPDERFDTRLITGPSNPCASAQAADGLAPGPSPSGVTPHGVTWYLTGSSKVTVLTHTTMELIPKLHVDGTRQHAVSIHVVCPGPPGPCATTPPSAAIAVEDFDGYHSHVLIHGQIWAPYHSVDLRSFIFHDDVTAQITSGVVAAQLFVDSANGTVGPLGPDLSQADHELLLSATATVGGVTMEARAVVVHRPGAPPGDRVAVQSIRLLD